MDDTRERINSVYIGAHEILDHNLYQTSLVLEILLNRIENLEEEVDKLKEESNARTE